MKKIQFLLTFMLCMVLVSASAQQKWDFTSLTDADKALCAADAD